MSGYEPPYHLPPLYTSPEAGPIWDANGPDGRLVDVTDSQGRTIGEISQMEGAPPHGWVRGPEGTAIPDYMMGYGNPPPGAIAAMQQGSMSSGGDDVPQHLLLLLE